MTGAALRSRMALRLANTWARAERDAKRDASVMAGRGFDEAMGTVRAG